jgi:hypothetical protein
MILQKCSLDGPVLDFSANQKTKMAVADVGFYIWENEINAFSNRNKHD